MTKEQCENDIIVSIDADEILLNPKEFFIDFLPITTKADPVISVVINVKT